MAPRFRRPRAGLGGLGWAALGLAIGCREEVYLGIPSRDGGGALPVLGPLHAVGATLFDDHDHPVVLRGINWAGMETTLSAPDGLHVRALDSVVGQIADLGFNCIRIPHANDALGPSSVPSALADAAPNPVAANPDLDGRTSLEILDRVVDSAAAHGLRVILARYRPHADPSTPSTWYTGATPDDPSGGYPESRWIDDWRMLAARYRDKPHVTGFDLHDEPQGPSAWASGDPTNDWRAAAERAGNQILAVNPNLLIIVEGVEVANDFDYWPGGNLAGAKAAPVRLTNPQKLVYSAHDYGMSKQDQGWFHNPTYPADLPPLWDVNWGFLVHENTAPVFVGSFGDRGAASGVTDDKKVVDALWLDALTQYLRDNELGFAFWSLNPSAEGLTGLLQGDWQTPDETTRNALSRLFR